jgi:hypothetical protein
MILAEMRTGSNFLESNLDLFPRLTCYGETFNPYFMVTPQTDNLFGVSVSERDEDPFALLDLIKQKTDGLAGFRFFHDHDPRVFDVLIDDPKCAKIVLTRNVVDAYVSRRIALETDQWQLRQSKDAVKKKARFIPDEFEKTFYRAKTFQLTIKNRLQRSGQTAFYIDYEDIQNLDVVNGMAKYLGEETQIAEFSGTYKKQNPEALSDKVSKFELLTATVNRLDVFDLHRLPNFEPGRPPAMKSYVASDATGLVFMPIPAGPTQRITDWLEQQGPLLRDFSQKELRKWKRSQKNHRSFTVLRHPVARLHSHFCDLVNWHEEDPNWDLKQALRNSYDVALPDHADQPWNLKTHQAAFINFIAVVTQTIAGKTSLPIAPSWASQSATIEGFSNFALPDHLLREDQLELSFPNLLQELDFDKATPLPKAQNDIPHSLTKVYTDQIEAAIRKLYQRDYMMFGFKPWG